jgi:NADP-dependent 3-hydroxy acid dehydrogenase YdfG
MSYIFKIGRVVFCLLPVERGHRLTFTSDSSGASVARKFAQKYAVALLARKAANYEPLVKEIESNGGRAVGISTDVVDGASVANAFETLKVEMKGAPLAAAVFNVGGKFIRKPFLELSEEDFMSGMEANG